MGLRTPVISRGQGWKRGRTTGSQAFPPFIRRFQLARGAIILFRDISPFQTRTSRSVESPRVLNTFYRPFTTATRKEWTCLIYDFSVAFVTVRLRPSPHPRHPPPIAAHGRKILVNTGWPGNRRHVRHFYRICFCRVGALHSSLTRFLEAESALAMMHRVSRERRDRKRSFN